MSGPRGACTGGLDVLRGSTCDGALLGLSQPPEATGIGSSVVFGVQDAKAAMKRASSGGIEFAGEIIELPGLVKLAKFEDPDGNQITFAESLEEADK